MGSKQMWWWGGICARSFCCVVCVLLCIPAVYLLDVAQLLHLVNGPLFSFIIKKKTMIERTLSKYQTQKDEDQIEIERLHEQVLFLFVTAFPS